MYTGNYFKEELSHLKYSNLWTKSKAILLPETSPILKYRFSFDIPVAFPKGSPILKYRFSFDIPVAFPKGSPIWKPLISWQKKVNPFDFWQKLAFFGNTDCWPKSKLTPSLFCKNRPISEIPIFGLRLRLTP